MEGLFKIQYECIQLSFKVINLNQTIYNCSQLRFTTLSLIKVSKGAKIRNRYNQVPHLTQDTNGKVTNS